MGKEITEKQLFVSSDKYIIEQVCEILDKNNIPFIKRIDGSGSYINISMGQLIKKMIVYLTLGLTILAIILIVMAYL